jgi:hypothetical protein
MNPLTRYILGPAYRTVDQFMARVRRSQSERIPCVELTQQHIRNLRVVLDREHFLRELPQGAVVAEIGVAQGDFSAQILGVCQPKELHLIDLWGSKRYHGGLGKHVIERFSANIEQGQVRIHQGYSTEVLEGFPDGYFDWIYIDTDHSYALTAAELALGMRKVKRGGIMAGHDFTTANWEGGVRYGVVEAVHEFCVANDWELILLTHETHRFLSFAIRAMVKD